jgi:hypothetical protein
MNRYEVNATLVYNEAMQYRFVDFSSQQSYDVGLTSKDAIDKTFSFIDKRYYPAIRGAGRTGYLSNGELKGALRNLAGLGKRVYKDFVPETLRMAIHDLEDGSILTFVSDNIGIPWELVYNDIDFWGRRFVIHKVDREYRLPLNFVDLKYSKVLNIVGATVDDNAKQAALELFDDAQEGFHNYVNIDGAQIDSIDDVFQEIADADLIHITCHGEFDQDGGLYLQIVNSTEPFMNLTPAVIDVLPIKPGCLVFANACVSAGLQPGIAKSIRFGSMFCSNERQGGAYIGTLDLIPDIPAIEFARCFYYQYLFRGYPVGEALRLAKCAQLNDGELQYGLFPLVYSLYGNPHVQSVSLYE